MADCWLKKRGKTYHLFFAKSVGRKPCSFHTKDRALARETQRRTESEIYIGECGWTRRVPSVRSLHQCNHARTDEAFIKLRRSSVRHTFASWLAAPGTDFKTLHKLIGRRPGEATHIYGHAFDSNKRSAIEKLTLPRKPANA